MKRLFFTLILLTISTLTIYSQKKPFSIEDLYKVKKIGLPVISNDSKKMLFAVTIYDLPNNKSNIDIYISNIDGSDQRQLTINKSADFDPIWDKEDKGFYFISYRNKIAQLYYLPLNGGEAKQITDFYMGVNSPKLSPDGRKIIFNTKLFPELGVNEDKTKELINEMDKGPIQAHLADSLFVRHWTEYNDGQYSHIIMFDLDNKYYTDLTPGYYNSPTFSPGGNDNYNFSP